MMKQNSLYLERKAYYYTHGNIREADNIWIVCHGYGQAADDFIKPFKILDKKRTVIISPEGLSRFYENGNEGNVVSSWMTKRYRETEIAEQKNFLNSIYHKYADEKKNIHVLGFSQGCATVARWLDSTRLPVSTMILWAGWPPADTDYNKNKDYWSRLKNFYIYGKNDRYLTEQRMMEFNQRQDLKVLDLQMLTFDGGHRLSRNILLKIEKLL